MADDKGHEWVCADCGEIWMLEKRFIFGYCPKCYGSYTQPITSYVGTLLGKIQFLIDRLDTVDGGYTFPDGDWWPQTKKKGE